MQVCFLLQHKIDIEWEVKQRSWTTLHRAAANGHIQTALAILRHWVDELNNKVADLINHSSEQSNSKVADISHSSATTGTTPLMAAAQSGFAAMTHLLLHQGADASTARLTRNGETTVMATAAAGQDSTLKVLLRDKEGLATINKTGGEGCPFPSALWAAVQNGHEVAARVLIDAKASLDVATPNGDTLLVLATSQGHIELIMALLNAGANGGRTKALEIARKNRNDKIEKLILAADPLDAMEKTIILRRASTKRESELTKHLIELLPDNIEATVEALLAEKFKKQFSGQLVPPRPTPNELQQQHVDSNGFTFLGKTPCGSVTGSRDGGVLLQQGPFRGIWMRVGCFQHTPWHRLWMTLRTYVVNFAVRESCVALRDAIERSHQESLRQSMQKYADKDDTISKLGFVEAVEALNIDLQPQPVRTLAICALFDEEFERQDRERQEQGGQLSTSRLVNRRTSLDVSLAQRQHETQRHRDRLEQDDARIHVEGLKWKNGTPSALYIGISMNAMQAIDITWLDEYGFRFHHYRPPGHGASNAAEAKPTDGTGEMVYFCWPGVGGSDGADNKVPGYATTIEGATGVCLTPDGSRMLCVWERGGWSTPGGAVNPGECKLEALQREVREEVGATVDLSRGATMVGGYSKGRARDNTINDSFAAFVVFLKDTTVSVDRNEISECTFLDWRWILQLWRDKGRPDSDDLVQLDELGRELGMPGRNLVRSNLLQWLDVYEQGKGLGCKVKEKDQNGKIATTVKFIQPQGPVQASRVARF